MFCPTCSTAAAEGAKFCKTCGLNLTIVTQALSGGVIAADPMRDREYKRARKSISDGIQGVAVGAALLLAIGLIGSGFLAVPVLTGSSAYAVSEIFGWREGLSRKASDARGFYGVIIAGTAVGMLFNFIGINPIDALFWTAVLNGFLAPPLLVLVMLVANDPAVMGSRTNGRWLNVLGWGTTLVMFAAAIGLVATWGH